MEFSNSTNPWNVSSNDPQSDDKCIDSFDLQPSDDVPSSFSHNNLYHENEKKDAPHFKKEENLSGNSKIAVAAEIQIQNIQEKDMELSNPLGHNAVRFKALEIGPPRTPACNTKSISFNVSRSLPCASQLEPGEVLIRVKAVSLSAIDAQICCDDSIQSLAQKSTATATTTTDSSNVDSNGIIVEAGQSRGNFVPGYALSGTIEALGSSATGLQCGSDVVCVVPLSSRHGGCAEYTVQSIKDIMPKPKLVSHVDAAASLSSGVRAFMAIEYAVKSACSRLSSSTILVLGGASAANHLVVQLALHRGATVICPTWDDASISSLLAYASNSCPCQYSCGNNSPPSNSQKKNTGPSKTTSGFLRIFDFRGSDNHENDLMEAILRETGGLGADVIIDDVVLSPQSNSEIDIALLVRCLAVRGTLVTSRSQVNLGAALTRSLFLKDASCAFLFEQAWQLAPSHQGRFRHVLKAVLEMVEKRHFVPLVTASFPLIRATEAYIALPKLLQRGGVVIEP
eukprot:g5560.t1